MIHKDLIRDIENTVLETGQAAFWWLGQHSFILKTKSRTLYLDPYLSERKSRIVSPPLLACEILDNDFIFGSHDHIDHIDHPIWKEVNKLKPNQKFIIPEALKKSLSEEMSIPLENFIGLNDDEKYEESGLSVTAIASAHELLDKDPETGLYPYLGFIIEIDGVVIYHSGDTCKYEGLESKLKNYQIDIAFLPINGRDAVRFKRNCIGNMTYQEAVDLAGAVKPKLTVPGHYGMFAHNTEDPQLFIDFLNAKYPDLNCIIPKFTEKFIYSKTK